MKSLIVWALYFVGVMFLFALTFLGLCLLPGGDKEPGEKKSGKTGKD
jgi:hypothetical protein